MLRQFELQLRRCLASCILLWLCRSFSTLASSQTFPHWRGYWLLPARKKEVLVISWWYNLQKVVQVAWGVSRQRQVRIALELPINNELDQISSFSQVAHILNKDTSERTIVKLYFLIPRWAREASNYLNRVRLMMLASWEPFDGEVVSLKFQNPLKQVLNNVFLVVFLYHNNSPFPNLLDMFDQVLKFHLSLCLLSSDQWLEGNDCSSNLLSKFQH